MQDGKISDQWNIYSNNCSVNGFGQKYSFAKFFLNFEQVHHRGTAVGVAQIRPLPEWTEKIFSVFVQPRVDREARAGIYSWSQPTAIVHRRERRGGKAEQNF